MMYRLAGKVLDFYDDPDRSVFRRHADRLKKVAGATGEIADEAELQSLRDRDFALVFVSQEGGRFRKYAMHTPTQTALSTAYLESCGYDLPDDCRKVAAYRLFLAHGRHRLPPPSYLMAMPKEAGNGMFFLHQLDEPDPIHDERPAPFVPDSQFLHVKVSEVDGSVTRYYRVTNYSQCKEAAEHFDKNYMDLQPTDRVKVALGIITKAEEFGVALDDGAVKKYASVEYNPEVDNYIAQRVQLLKERPEQAVLLKLSEKKAGYPATVFAEVLEGIDKMAGLDALWDKQIPDPYAAVLGDPIDAVKVAGRTVTLKEIRKVASNEGRLQEFFRDELIAKFKAEPEKTFFELPESVQAAVLGI